MSEVSQGPGWWQASDLKWYPPEQHADYKASLPPPPAQPPASGQRKTWFVLSGLGLFAVALMVVGRRVLPGMAPALLDFLLMVAIVIIGAGIAARSGQSGVRKLMFGFASVLVAGAIFLAGDTVGGLFFGGPTVFGRGSSGGVAHSADSSSFCPDFLQYWMGPQGVQNAIIAVQAANRNYHERPNGWNASELQTAADNARTLAAEAPTAQLKTDFTNIADTLAAAVKHDYTYYGTGNEQLDVINSGAAPKCRLHMPLDH